MHNNLSEIEKKKMRKTVRPPAPPDHESVNNATPRRLARRFNKSLRRQRKREQFLAKRKSTPSETNDKLQHLNPVNLSELSLSEDQNKLLRKGPSFCPAPRDINWQEVHDDLESFEARLRTAVFFLEKETEESTVRNQDRSHLPSIPGKKAGNHRFLNSQNLTIFYQILEKTLLILVMLVGFVTTYLRVSVLRSGHLRIQT